MAAIIAFILLVASVAHAFRLNFTTPLIPCSNVTLTWSGGRAPYEILLIPVGRLVPETRTIINYQSIHRQSFSFPLTFPSSSKFIAILSDSSGPAFTSQVLTVHNIPALSGQDCLATQQVKPEFYFYLDPAVPQQCGPLEISWPLSQSNKKISVWAVIPGGPSFAIPFPSFQHDDDDKIECDWVVDVEAGTQILLVAGNSEVNGRGKGGSTDLLVVQNSTFGSLCLGSTPATSRIPTSTSSSLGSAKSSAVHNPNNSSSNNPSSAPSLRIVSSTWIIPVSFSFLSYFL